MQQAKIRCYPDLEPIIDRVRLGQTVSFRVGGMHRPRRPRITPDAAFEVLDVRLGEIGGRVWCTDERGGVGRRRRIGRLFRGRFGVAFPVPDDGGDEAGVREPRPDRPPRPGLAAEAPLPRPHPESEGPPPA